MSSEAKPTPTPWQCKEGPDTAWWIGPAKGILPGIILSTVGGNDEANAKRVVECVNGYDELRAQRDAALAKLREVEALTGELTPEVWVRLSDAQGYVRCGEDFCSHDNALLRAKGERP